MDSNEVKIPEQTVNINTLSTDEFKRLSDFFSILIQIDKREEVTKPYEKTN